MLICCTQESVSKYCFLVNDLYQHCKIFIWKMFCVRAWKCSLVVWLHLLITLLSICSVLQTCEGWGFLSRKNLESVMMTWRPAGARWQMLRWRVVGRSQSHRVTTSRNIKVVRFLKPWCGFQCGADSGETILACRAGCWSSFLSLDWKLGTELHLSGDFLFIKLLQLIRSDLEIVCSST